MTVSVVFEPETFLHQLFGRGSQQPQVFLQESGMSEQSLLGLNASLSLQKSSLSSQAGLGGTGVGEGAGVGDGTGVGVGTGAGEGVGLDGVT